MKLTAQQVFDVTPLLAQAINRNVPTSPKGAYRRARLHAKLEPEYNTISAKRDDLIKGYGNPIGQDRFAVPAEKEAEFQAHWAEIAAEVIEIDAEPIPPEALGFGGIVATT